MLVKGICQPFYLSALGIKSQPLISLALSVSLCFLEVELNLKSSNSIRLIGGLSQKKESWDLGRD